MERRPVNASARLAFHRVVAFTQLSRDEHIRSSTSHALDDPLIGGQISDSRASANLHRDAEILADEMP